MLGFISRHIWKRLENFAVAILQARVVEWADVIPPLETQINGQNFLAHAPNGTTRKRWLRLSEKSKEPETIRWVEQRLNSNSVFVDIGANTGNYSILAAITHPGIDIYMHLNQSRTHSFR